MYEEDLELVLQWTRRSYYYKYFWKVRAVSTYPDPLFGLTQQTDLVLRGVHHNHGQHMIITLKTTDHLMTPLQAFLSNTTFQEFVSAYKDAIREVCKRNNAPKDIEQHIASFHIVLHDFI